MTARRRGPGAATCSSLMAELLDTNDAFDNLGVVNRDGSIFCSGIGGDLSVILNDRAGLIGASIHAQSLAKSAHG